MRSLLCSLALAASLAACAPAAPPAAPDTAAIETAARAAHDDYVEAINSNNVDTLMGMLTDDVVYLSPHEPVLVGKAAVRAWSEAYFGAYEAKWDKTSEEFTVAGDWAIERYAYKSTDTPKAGGSVVIDTGKGINIYHHDADGVWRIARDAWNSDLPLATK